MRKSLKMSLSKEEKIELKKFTLTTTKTKSVWRKGGWQLKTTRPTEGQKERFIYDRREAIRATKRPNNMFTRGIGTKPKLSENRRQAMEESGTDASVYGSELIGVRTNFVQMPDDLAELNGHGIVGWTDFVYDEKAVAKIQKIDAKVARRVFHPRTVRRSAKVEYSDGMTSFRTSHRKEVKETGRRFLILDQPQVGKQHMEAAFRKYMQRVNPGNPRHFHSVGELLTWCTRFGLAGAVAQTLNAMAQEIATTV